MGALLEHVWTANPYVNVSAICASKRCRACMSQPIGLPPSARPVAMYKKKIWFGTMALLVQFPSPPRLVFLHDPMLIDVVNS